MLGADTTACLLANDGLVTIGEDLDAAMETPLAVESVAQVYCQARAVGTPEPLPETELDRVKGKPADYRPDEG